MERKLSIVQVIDQLLPGGAERVLLTVSNILYRNGHQVKVITTVSPGALLQNLDHGISHVCLYRKWKFNPFTMRQLIHEIKDHDIIHVHSVHNLKYVWIAMQLYRLKKRIIYQEHHGARASEKPGWLLKKMMKQNIFIGVSSDLKMMAQQELKIPEYHSFVLPNIIERQNKIPAGKSSEMIQLLIVSNFVRVKNIEFAIEVFEQLLKQGKQIRLSIIGHINDRDYYNEILQLIQQKQLNNFIEILHQVDNIQPLLYQYQLALHTSKYESGPLVLLEYMAQELPFISHLTGEVAQKADKVLPECFMHDFNTDKWIKRINSFLKTDVSVLKHTMTEYFNKACSANKYYEQCMEIYDVSLKE